MASVKSRDPRKAAKQERSRATLDAVFEAMDRVVSRAGVEEFSIVEVAREAGIGRASIYDYFPTREALVAAWEDRVFEGEMARVGERVLLMFMNPPGFEQAITQLVDLIMESFAEKARQFKYTARIELMGVTAARGQFAERVVTMLASAMENAPDRPRFRVERLDVAARIGVNSLLHVARTLAVSNMSEEEHRVHRREVARMLYRYILRDPKDVELA